MSDPSKISSKYFTNDKDYIIKDSLTGELLSNPNIIYYPQYNFIYDKTQLNSSNVRLVCGGGSGHEPSHSGYITKGMLTSAVCGDIFSSPSCKNIIKAIEKIYSDSGVILIVKNYSGDVINFSLACELFKNLGKKIFVKMFEFVALFLKQKVRFFLILSKKIWTFPLLTKQDKMPQKSIILLIFHLI